MVQKRQGPCIDYSLLSECVQFSNTHNLFDKRFVLDWRRLS